MIPFFPKIVEFGPMDVDPESLPQEIQEWIQSDEPDSVISSTIDWVFIPPASSFFQQLPRIINPTDPEYAFVVEQFPEFRENISANTLIEDVLPGLLTSWGALVASEPAEAEPTIPEVGVDALA